MINPKMHKQGSPEWVLAKFLEAWKDRAWKRMVNYVRRAWIGAITDPKVLEAYFNPKLIDARLIQANARTPAVTEYLIEIEYKIPSVAPKKVVSKIRLYSEILPSQDMVWGVEPTTITLETGPTRKAEPEPVADKAQVEEEADSVESHKDKHEEGQKKVKGKKEKASTEPEPEA